MSYVINFIEISYEIFAKLPKKLYLCTQIIKIDNHEGYHH